MNTKPLLLTCVLLVASLAAQAGGDNDWQLRVKKENNGWSASFHGTNEYGPAGKRVRGSGHQVEKERQIGAFSKLRVEGPVDVQLSQGAAEKLSVLADDNIEPLVETRIEGDTLIVRVQHGAGYSTRHDVVARVQFKQMNALEISGSGDVRLERLKGEALNVAISGSGDLEVGLIEVKNLAVNIDGSGDVQIAGRADTQSWRLSGSGDVDAEALSGRSAMASLSGSGDLNLGVVEQLDARLSGSGDLNYAGRPQLTQRVSGSGEISSR
ncbi:MAG TPA: head GIN domain-containing protein [Burkholderiaceae bacterium]